MFVNPHLMRLPYTYRLLLLALAPMGSWVSPLNCALGAEHYQQLSSCGLSLILLFGERIKFNSFFFFFFFFLDRECVCMHFMVFGKELGYC